MLTIRREQWAVFERDAQRRSVQWLAAELPRHFPGATDDPASPDWVARIEAGVQRAQGLGLATRGDLLRFLALEARYGPGFLDRPQHAWMRGMLTDPRVPTVSQRVQRLIQAIVARGERAEEKRDIVAQYLAEAEPEE